MKKILVPCDFSPPAEEAFRFAASIALQNNNSEIHVLYVIDRSISNNSDSSLSYSPAFQRSGVQKLEDQWHEKFADMKKVFAPDLLSVTLKIDIGSLTPTIENYIQDNHIDLVVMGTHGASGFKELFFGSKTEKIVRYSKVPVIAIPSGATLDAISNIVFPVEPSLYTTHPVHEIKEIQNFFRAKLHILWINTPHLFKSDAEIMEDLQDFADLHHLTDYTLNTRSEYIEQDGILRFAKEFKGCLITMPTHGRKGIKRWMAGSITENVVNHVHCPVWTYSIKEN
jgi:nucleotide-binding universal stress UspA family protein